MTPLELQALSIGVAKIALVCGMAGALLLELVICLAFRCVLLIGALADRHQRIAQARKRSLQASVTSSCAPAAVTADQGSSNSDLAALRHG